MRTKLAWLAGLTVFACLQLISPLAREAPSPGIDPGPPVSKFSEAAPTSPKTRAKNGEYPFQDPHLNVDNYKVDFDGQSIVAAQRGGWVLGFGLDGKKIWDFVNSGTWPGMAPRPLIVGDIVLVYTPRAELFALDTRTGRIRWVRSVGKRALASPRLVPGDPNAVALLYVDQPGHWVYSVLDIRTAEVLSSLPSPFCETYEEADLSEQDGAIIFRCGQVRAFTVGDGYWTPIKAIAPKPAKEEKDLVQGPRHFAGGTYSVYDDPPRVRVLPDSD